MVVRGGHTGSIHGVERRSRSHARALLPVALLGLLITGLARGQTPAPPGAERDPAEAFAAANRHYEGGHFAEAARGYQEIVDRGYESAALYFNLGNALLKIGELGEAIVSYERARELAPRADDIRENLERARKLAVDVVPAPAGSIFLSRLAGFKDWFSPAEALIAASFGLWLVLAAVAATRLIFRGRKFARALTWVLLGLWTCTAGLAAIKVAEAARRTLAVVVQREVPVRTGPGEHYTVRFNLHEGTTVRILRTAGDFAEIELTAETGGWVPQLAVVSIRR
jgi:tetratricopeptide (TPR) repeat protein